ncbi:ABC transporter ATP-binding protein [Vibrio mediterranei]|uniref:ABC transporter ATP-binding protein n=1 Tax=Vibrio mediterranei TaxID=689 RepID=UPI0018242245|nr:ABC transporter ATP-binding protein [Vibrio mediterranei]NUW73833.1 ABC transporter ATP-binding protein [Vibrio mediterranei]
MSEILTVRNLSKSYVEYDSELFRVLGWFGFNSRNKKQEVLKDISFSIKKGEAVGVIGKNGAGKSTLLKLITGTLNPTKGEVKSFGRTSAILELGMGFNPELTGRENTYHSSGLMGQSQEAINKKVKEIEDFAEIGEFFDLPIRTYSSGMQARLAFAVATAFRPDILIVDEALSVGDVSFQAKCFNHMKQIKESGTSILLVSHDAQAIMNFCDRAILLHEGEVAFDGVSKETIQLYDKLVDNYEKIEKTRSKESENLSSHRLSGCDVLDKNGLPQRTFFPGDQVTLRARFHCGSLLNEPHVGFRVADRFGVSVFETNTHCMGVKSEEIKKGNDLTVEFSFCLNVGHGEFSIDFALVNEGINERSFRESLLMCHNVININVIENKSSFIFSGTAYFEPSVKISIGDNYDNS